MKSLPEDKVRFLEVVARRIVPEVGDLDAAAASEFLSIIDAALMDRPARMRRQLAVFLGVLRWAPLLRWARTFEALSAVRQDAVLRWFEDCPLALLRKGFWGLKAIVFMGYYGRPDVWQAIGYAPSFDSRQKLHV